MALTWTQTSAAQPKEDARARLETLLRDGDTAAKAKQWQACIEARTAAFRIEDAANIAGDLGLCEEQAGRLGDAMNHLLRALAEATPAMKAQEPWKSYQAAVRRIEPKVVFVLVTVLPRDAVVLMDGRPLGKADGHRLAMTLGEHTFVMRAEGYEDAVFKRVVTRELRNIDVVLDKKPTPAAPPAPALPSAPTPVPPRATPASPATSASAPPQPEAKPAPSTSFPCLPARSLRGVLVPLACVSGAAFVVSAATAIGLEVHAASLRADLQARGFQPNACVAGQPQAGSAECADIDNRVRQRTDAANVMIGTGIAAAVLAAGAGLAIALEPKGPKVAAAASPAGGAIILEGAW